ncbi:hypothetical protein IWZ03DRAFT_382060 [Phyllosticta citriasiana]|uniref:Uncharacterized protein n=1 Tax=Phyllosticta citriasiana TaxID=595635 RepID=A0ABR1KHN1_9PEZI
MHSVEGLACLLGVRARVWRGQGKAGQGRAMRGQGQGPRVELGRGWSSLPTMQWGTGEWAGLLVSWHGIEVSVV